ncbi:hypothetical protein CCM_05964 [Cordyceps militaris CM01]|uniref:Uncharacterized protein n=1 Tax=Cordyceps militaris (strain CM01) TaxID=983644 RepID=G3JI04_CORMM|nr:uncharacterized protein CCM_05964 [Cordyceps militaris CM01]EGX91807.1 hypothetical protein CCM_05964 [Cordyceps militaris CM01]
MAQAPPAYINIPQPGSNPDTPSEIPGTPTSTTTSLSALSTTAIKDGHRGHLPGVALGRGHQHTPSTTSLEAERADRISRLAGLERVSTVRAPPPHTIATGGPPGAGASSLSPQTTPTSTSGFPANFPASHNLTPSYFDVNGQPVAVTKMSTVGTASATESSHHGDGGTGSRGSRQTAADRDEDMFSTDTNYRETADSVASMAAEPDAMDEEIDEGIATRSVGGYEDRMSDDGSASLVGFGEGANSTVSGPIYHRRPVPGSAAAQQQQAPWTVERSASGLSDIRRERDFAFAPGAYNDMPASAAALQERREARMMDGVAADAGYPGAEYEPYVDTTFRGPVPINAMSLRQQQQQQQQQQQPREVAEQIAQRLDGGSGSGSGSARSGAPPLGHPGQGGEPLGQFSFDVDRDGRRG